MQQKTRDQIEALKSLWLEDPTAFDITKAEGFEAHQEELEAFAAEQAPPPEFNPFDFIAEQFKGFKKSFDVAGKVAMLDNFAYYLLMSQDQLSVLDPKESFEPLGYQLYQAAEELMNGRERFLRERKLPGGYAEVNEENRNDQ